MKLINYNYGYINKFNCVIRGKIIVSQNEWKAIRKYLLNPFTRAYYLWKDVLKKDFNRFIQTKEGKLYNIRVTATEKVSSKFGLNKYKQNNYMFLVKGA